ncbi:ATP-binding protein [Streptomyces capillispiralis]|uniref:ATP-binding protein n=1 Tax=Streptomyces capillispiralis TaxID=68182 RepID=UPI0036B0FA74
MARSISDRVLEGWPIPGECREAIRLLVSELVTNAVLHGQAPIGLKLSHERNLPQSRLRIEVSDRSPGHVRARAASEQDECGRGMKLIDALTERWGEDSLSSGKRVWCEVDVTGA